MSSFLDRRASVLKRRPLVVGTLTGRRDVAGQLRAAASRFIDVVEIRLDTFSQVHSASGRVFAGGILDRVRRRCRKPILLTLRSHAERGVSIPARERLDDRRREALLAPLLPGAALVDVEARSRAFARRITAMARRLGVGVIHSFHDFKTLSQPKVLDRWCAEARRGGADIFKAAVTPRDGEELARFLRWGMGVRRIRPVLIGMGAAGAPSRTVGFSFGSVLTYGHLGVSAAPGQLPAAELGRAVRAIYGDGK